MSNMGSNPVACQLFGHAWIIRPLASHTLELVCQNCGTVQD